MASQDLREQIIDLEEATWRALKKTGSAMVPYTSDDCIMQFPLGMKLTPRSDPSVQDILHSPAFEPWKSFKLENIDVTPIGKAGAVISYLAKATKPLPGEEEKDAEFEALCCSVWRWDGEKFVMCFHQQTLTT